MKLSSLSGGSPRPDAAAPDPEAGPVPASCGLPAIQKPQGRVLVRAPPNNSARSWTSAERSRLQSVVMHPRVLPIVAALSILAACGDDAAPPATSDASTADAAVDTGATNDADAIDAFPDVSSPPLPPAPARPIEPPFVRYVDPFIGTGGLGYGVGSTFPGPQRPFGMVRPGPDTTEPDGALLFEHCSGYDYDDSLVMGFSLTRMHGTGIADYGVPGFMPTLGMTASKTHQDGYRAALDKSSEQASPGYYRVLVGDDIAAAIDVELTATDRVAFARFTFPPDSGTDATVLLDMGHVIGNGEIVDGEVNVDPVSGLDRKSVV